ncbi:MAG: hypothetical protein IPG45_15910 [Deltaproteobacteria bacterium]|nr:hypothetical protein [Deltaproteobacteria bacterium]
MAAELEPSNYSQLPILDLGGATAMGTGLLHAKPRDMPAFVDDAAAYLREVVDESLASWGSERGPGPDLRRPADASLDRSWGAVFTRLKAFAELPHDEYALAKEAAALMDRLFPDGLAFLRLPYAQEWAESERRLQMIDNEKLTKTLDKAAGPEFLQQVRRNHVVYGEVLGITKPDPMPQGPARAEHRKNLRKAISRYVFAVLASAVDEESTLRALAALRPIDTFRANAQARRAASNNVEVEEQPPAEIPAPIEVAAPSSPPVAAPPAAPPPAPVPAVPVRPNAEELPS